MSSQFRHFLRKILFSFLVSLLLNACGGGGGGSPTSNTASGGATSGVGGDWLNITPASFDLKVEEGHSAWVIINANALQNINKVINVKIIEIGAHFNVQGSLTKISDYQYKYATYSDHNLRPGKYVSTFQIWLCEDDPLKCTKPIAGSPWIVPVNLEVTPTPIVQANLILPTKPATNRGEAGSSIPLNFEVKTDSSLSGPAILKVVDLTNKDFTTNLVSIDVRPNQTYQVSFLTKSNLAGGTHTGSFQLYLCRVDATSCTFPVGYIKQTTFDYSVFVMPAQTRIPTLSFYPSALNFSMVKGFPDWFSIKVTSANDLDRYVNVKMSDIPGLFKSRVMGTNELAPNSNVSFFFDPEERLSQLGVGNYSGYVTVDICEDAVNVCSKPIPGSPWRLPFTLALKNIEDAASLNVVSDPTQLNLATYENESAEFMISPSIDWNVKVLNTVRYTLVDKSGYVLPLDSQGFRSTIKTNPNLKAGTYFTNLEVHACINDAIPCTTPIPGSPKYLPLKLEVKPKTNLTTLTPIAGLAGWNQFRGDATQINSVEASFDPTRFTRRWVWKASNKVLTSDIVVDNNILNLIVRDATNTGDYSMIALSEHDAAQLWSTNIGQENVRSNPLLINGKLFAKMQMSGSAFLGLVDQKTGQIETKFPTQSGDATFAAQGSEVFIHYAASQALRKFDVTKKTETDVLNNLAFAGWVPAVNDNMIYTISATKLVEINRSTGTSKSLLLISGLAYSDNRSYSIALSKNGYAYINNGSLSAINLQKSAQLWTYDYSPGLPINIQSGLALANGKLFGLGFLGHPLREFDALSGVFSEYPYTGLTSYNNFVDLIATTNLVFVSQKTHTFAFDTKSKQIVWTYPLGGTLSISKNGVLLIRDANRIDAINLR